MRSTSGPAAPACWGNSLASYPVYIESGPKRRKTMVHVADLLGCVATGPTTDAALEATPAAIVEFLRFVRRHEGQVPSDDRVDITVAEHITEGSWLGNGSPYIAFAWDLEPTSQRQVEEWARRFRAMRDELAGWVAGQSPEELDGEPQGGGRPARRVLEHIMGASGSYLAAALGGATGFSRVASAAGRGDIPFDDALRRQADLVEQRVAPLTAEQLSAVRELNAGPRTLRKAMRRLLEHDWEHRAELARRPGGPAI